MSRATSKKRQHKESPPKQPAPIKSKPRHWMWMVAAILLPAAVLFAFYLQRAGKPVQPGTTAALTADDVLKSLSGIEIQGSEKQVIEKILKLAEEVKANPKSAEAWGRLAMNLDVHDMKNQAVECFRKAAELNPSDFRWPYYLAIVLYDQGSPESLKYFGESLALNPAHLAGRLRYGQALLDAGRLEEAGREYTSALNIDPGSSHACLGLARIKLIQGQVEECRSLLLKAIELNPRHGEAHGLLSEVYRRMNQRQLADEQLSIAQQLPKRTPLPDELLAALVAEGVSSFWYDTRGRAALESGDFGTAEREYGMAARVSNDPRYQDTLGVVYLYQGKYAEAAAAHRQALKLDPRSTTSMNNLAAALYETGQKEEATELVRKAIRIDPDLPYSYLHLARLYLRSGNEAEAVRTYRTGLQRLPRNADLMLQLAWMLATSRSSSLRDGREAVRLAESAAGQNRNAQSLDVLAAACAEAGLFDRAIPVAEQALAAAESARNPQLAQRIAARLGLFRSKQPYRE